MAQRTPTTGSQVLERLGESREFQTLLLRLAGLRGWRLYQQTAFAGCASLFWLCRDSGEIVGPVAGASEGDVAVDLFKAAMRHDRLVNA